LVSNDGQYKQSLSVIDAKTGTVRQTTTYLTPEALFIGLAYSPDGAHAYASAGGNNKIRVYDVQAGGTLVEATAIQLPQYADLGGTPTKVNHCPAGIAVSADGRTLWTANSRSDSVSVVDLGTLEVTIVPAGSHPYAVALSPDGRTAYVSDWGGADLATIDTATLAPGPFVAVGTHPSALKVNKVRGELYVANTDSDTVSVVDLKRKAVTRTIDLAPYRGAPVGSNPNAFALSPLGDTLYVANAGASAVDVIALGGRWRSDRIRGRIPTGWYPTAVETSKDGRTIFVANAKGLGAGPNPDNVVDGMSLPANDAQAT
jgi:YVTN family beta-propeller protein